MRNAQNAEAALPVKRSKYLNGGNGSRSGAEQQQAQYILEAMLALREGDLSQRLPASWSGVFGKIAAAYNDVAAWNDRRVRENQRVCQAVGKEGKLKQRMRVPGAAGARGGGVGAFNYLGGGSVGPGTQ